MLKSVAVFYVSIAIMMAQDVYKDEHDNRIHLFVDNETDNIPKCGNDFISDIDDYIIRGQVNSSGINLRTISIEQKMATVNKYVCLFFVSKDCNNELLDKCSCSKSTDDYVVNFTVTLKLLINDSLSRVNAGMLIYNSPAIYSNDIQLPLIHQLNFSNYTFELQINDQVVDSTSCQQKNVDKMLILNDWYIQEKKYLALSLTICEQHILKFNCSFIKVDHDKTNLATFENFFGTFTFVIGILIICGLLFQYRKQRKLKGNRHRLKVVHHNEGPEDVSERLSLLNKHLMKSPTPENTLSEHEYTEQVKTHSMTSKRSSTDETHLNLLDNYYQLTDMIGEHFMENIIFFVVVPSIVSEFNISCSHANEGNSSVLQVRWEPIQETRILIKENNKELITCISKQMTCESLTDSILHYAINVSNLLIFELRNNNSLRHEERHVHRNWAVFDLIGNMQTCSYSVYVKPQDIECKSLSEDELDIVCITKKVFPKANCFFYINFTEPYISESNSESCNNEDDRHYLCSVCKVLKEIDKEGTYKIIVTVYPNITGTTQDRYYGTNTTFEKTFAEPSLVLEECPVNAIVGSELRCHCIMKGFGSTKAEAKWYKKDNTLISNTSRLAYTLDENDSEFVCEVNMIKLQRSLQTTLNISLNISLTYDPNTYQSNTNNVYN
ncbi:polymorphic transmembrane cluster 2 transmembrane protein 10, partial [Biomphalaria pfeifferi]